MDWIYQIATNNSHSDMIKDNTDTGENIPNLNNAEKSWLETELSERIPTHSWQMMILPYALSFWSRKPVRDMNIN